MNHRPSPPCSAFERVGNRRAAILVAGVLVTLALVASVASFAFADATDFPDVPAGHPYHAAISDLASRAIVSGFEDGTFRPGDDVKRQQFAKMIVLAGGYPVSEADVCPFSDVEISGAAGLYPDNYVAACAARGITLGLTATTFDPYGSITRYQVISMVVRAADDLRPARLAAPPAGWSSPADWDVDATHGANAARAEHAGLLDGLDLAALSPYGPMTRGEVAQVLHNLLAWLAATGATTTTTAGTTTSTAATTTTTSSTTTTTVPSTTTTTSSTTTISTTSTTGTTPPGGGGTTPTTAPPPPTEYSVAGLEAAQITATVRDQFGNPMPNIEVFLTSEALEGAGLAVVTNLSIGKTDAYGNVAYNWTQSTGDWGVEQMKAWVYSSASPDGIIMSRKIIQWVYDDRATDYVSAVAGQQKVTVVSGYAPWNGLTLRAYLNPAAAALGSGTYVSSGGLSLTTSHTWVSGEALFVGAVSANNDGKPNWMYNLVP